MSWGMPPWLSCRYPTTVWFSTSIFAIEPPNSHVNSTYLPSMVKSAWLMPSHPGTSSELMCAIVCGSRKSSRLRASATLIAYLPSGVKYMLYGSSTVTDCPGLPVFGSIGVSVPSVVPSALLVTHRVERSYEGTTCWGLRPTSNVSTTFIVAGSITDTVLAARLGT